MKKNKLLELEVEAHTLGSIRSSDAISLLDMIKSLKQTIQKQKETIEKLEQKVKLLVE
jgi:hypothetical protein